MKSFFSRIFNKETILYIVFGVVTTLVNYAVYYPLVWAGLNFKYANIIAWVAAVIAAYITNKLFVFESKSWDVSVVLREIGLFALARLLSLAIEEGFLILTVDVFGASELLMKIVASVFVIIVNYIFSKLVIFKKKDTEN